MFYQKLCVCGNSLERYPIQHCDSCIEQAKNTGRKNRKLRKEAKLCYCGKPLNGKSTTRCTVCMSKELLYTKTKRQNLRLNGICLVCCNQKVIIGRTKCLDCTTRRNNLWNLKYQTDVEFRAKIILRDALNRDQQKQRKSNLTLNQVIDMLKLNCHYCKEENLAEIGLDRIDNSRGYIHNNVLPCCTTCNMIRRDMPFEAWMILSEKMPDVKKSGTLGNWRSFGVRKATRVHKTFVASLD